MADCGDRAVHQLQTIVPVQGGRLIRESRLMQRSEEPLATAIARKHSSGTIAAMSGRC